MAIREVGHEDLVRVAELLQQLWPEKRVDIEDDAMRETMDKYFNGTSYRIYGYEEETLLGIITASFRWALFYQGKVAIIEDLVVDRSHRGKGIGSRLVDYLEHRIYADDSVKGIELSSDLDRDEAHQFWEKCGYSKLAFQFRKAV